MRIHGSTRKCFITSTQAGLFPVLARYKSFTIPDLEDYYKTQGKRYSKAVLYENVEMLAKKFLDEDKPRNVEGRLVRAYKLNDLGYAWAWWLSLPDADKIKEERRRRQEADEVEARASDQLLRTVSKIPKDAPQLQVMPKGSSIVITGHAESRRKKETTSEKLASSQGKDRSPTQELDRIVSDTRSELLAHGLSRDQTQVYIYLSVMGPRGLNEISKATGMSRTRLSNLLEDLIDSNKQFLLRTSARPYRFSAIPISKIGSKRKVESGEIKTDKVSAIVSDSNGI